MSLGHGASVVRDGLVLHLDAANPKSYPGSGTTWYDLSGNFKHHTLLNSPTYATTNNGEFTLNGTSQGFYFNGSLSGVTTSCTVVIWYKTTDNQELWVRGNQDNTYYLSASYGNNYYHNNVGSPINYVDTNQVVNPVTEGYRNGIYHMWEAKNVDFSSWTYFDWFTYPGGWYMAGTISSILVYDRPLSSSESLINFEALRGRYGI